MKSDLEGQCLTKEEREVKRLVDNRWASMVYHGEWFHPLKEELDALALRAGRCVGERKERQLEQALGQGLHAGQVDRGFHRRG